MLGHLVEGVRLCRPNVWSAHGEGKASAPWWLMEDTMEENDEFLAVRQAQALLLQVPGAPRLGLDSLVLALAVPNTMHACQPLPRFVKKMEPFPRRF